jgi:type II secretory pathway pseudopilin PulG
MRTVFHFSAPLLIVAVLSALAAPVYVSAALEFEQTRIEQQAKLLDDQSMAVFRFTNTGDQPIEILRVQSSCGCTVPELDKQQYAPGESGEIRALFTFGSRQGRQMKRVTLTTNDPARTTYQLDFITHIPTWGQISPRMLRWSVGGEPEPRAVRVTLPTAEGLTVKEPSGLETFRMERMQGGNGERYYQLTPLSTEQGVTEKVAFELVYEADGETVTRELSFYAIIR